MRVFCLRELLTITLYKMLKLFRSIGESAEIYDFAQAIIYWNSILFNPESTSPLAYLRSRGHNRAMYSASLICFTASSLVLFFLSIASLINPDKNKLLSQFNGVVLSKTKSSPWIIQFWCIKFISQLLMVSPKFLALVMWSYYRGIEAVFVKIETIFSKTWLCVQQAPIALTTHTHNSYSLPFSRHAELHLWPLCGSCPLII